MTEPSIDTPAAPATESKLPEARTPGSRTGSSAGPAGVPTTAPGREPGRLPLALTRGAWLVPVLGLAWLAAKLWSSHRQIQASGGGTIAVATAALALPGVVQATLAAGLGAGLLATGGLRRGATVRWIASTAAGLLVGLAAFGLIIGEYGHLTSMLAVAISVAVAGLLGGAIAAIGPAPSVLRAGLAGLLGAFVTATVLNSGAILSQMMKAFGAGDTFSSQLHANNVVAFVDSLIGGVIAGVIAYSYLRRRDSATGDDSAPRDDSAPPDDRAPGRDDRRRIPAYVVAGGITGVVLLSAELITRTGGADLANAVKSISPDDRAIIDLLAPARVINAMVVLFVGAFVALVAFGRTIRPSGPPINSPDGSGPGGSGPHASAE